MRHTVVLRHDLPDGTHHFDWLLGPPGEALGEGDPDARVLIAWRTAERIDGIRAGAVEAERLAAHRRVYLSYEGPVSGGRGGVTRVCAGRAGVLLDGRERFEAWAEFGAGRVGIVGTPGEDGKWRLWVGDPEVA